MSTTFARIVPHQHGRLTQPVLHGAWVAKQVLLAAAGLANLSLTRYCVIIIALACAEVANADVAAPPGYVEGCTRENATETDEECIELSRWVFDGRCVKTLVDEGFCARCGKGTTMRTELYCRKRRATALPQDWATKCLAEPDPKRLDPKDLPKLPAVEQCPTERTKSFIAGEEETTPEAGSKRRSGGCGCSVTRSEPVGVWALLVLMAVLCQRRVR